jgi:uncharacterized protein
MDLAGRVAILTGASRGIGAMLAEALAARGVNLALAARSEEDLGMTAMKAQSDGVRVVAEVTDVTRIDDLESLVDETIEELGPPDILINNAGIERIEYFHEADPDGIRAIVDTNLTAAILLTRLVVPGMIERGRGQIVNISSVAGKSAVPYNAVYSATKHGLVGLSWSLREELKPHGIGVGVVCPGPVRDTGMYYLRHPDNAATFMSSTVAPEKVVAATVAAIEKNRAETIVMPGLAKVVDVFEALSHDFTAFVARKSGVYAFLERELRERS